MQLNNNVAANSSSSGNSTPTTTSAALGGAAAAAVNSSSPPSPFPPGMLSAALLGTPPLPPVTTTSSSCSSSSSNGSGHGLNSAAHPPTPPRTPKTPSSQSDLAGLLKNGPPMHGSSGMSPLLSLAAIQEQAGGGNTGSSSHHGSNKSPHNILAAHLSKPMMMPGGGILGMPPHPSPLGQIPPHILAAQRVGLLPGPPKSNTDYTRYFKRFGSSLECGSLYCKDMNYREHFHCTVPMCKDKAEKYFQLHSMRSLGKCQPTPFMSQVFAKKEEMIRHSKWHQKMDEAFKYGFRRVTPMDDCSDQFPGCQHNKKQTHYHCIHTDTCDKCYISTSDVQMHFNYHRKDNAIQREGFLR